VTLTTCKPQNFRLIQGSFDLTFAQDRRHPSTAQRDGSMSNRIYAPVQEVKRAAGKASLYRPTAHVGGEQPPPRDYAMLAAGELRQPTVQLPIAASDLHSPPMWWSMQTGYGFSPR
jgi:hypothetical protein